MTLDDLKNNGIINIGTDNRVGEPTTIVVIGVPRSGTSMVGATLQALGIFLGDEIDTSVFEDRRLSGAFESSDEEKLREVIHDYDRQHNIWAFKRPKAFVQLQNLLAQLRNPRLVVIFRDPVAIAVRNSKSVHHDVIQGVQQAAKAALAVLAAVDATDCPALLISYEKSMSDRELFLSSLIRFCGLPVQAEQIKAARTVMNNGPDLYLSNARVIYQGRFKIKEQRIIGWIITDAQIPELCIVQDGELTRTIRPIPKDNPPYGICEPGFKFAWFDEEITNSSLKTKVRVNNTTFYLTETQVAEPIS